MADKRKMKNEGTWKASLYTQSLHNLIAIKRFRKEIIVLQMVKQRELFTLDYKLHLFLIEYMRHFALLSGFIGVLSCLCGMLFVQ